jgi:hypothetical protein
VRLRTKKYLITCPDVDVRQPECGAEPADFLRVEIIELRDEWTG